MFSLKEILIGYLFYSFSPQFIFIILFYLCKIHKYIIIGDKELNNTIMKKISKKIMYSENYYINGKNIPHGYFIGWNYFGCIQMRDNDTNIILWTKEHIYKDLLQDTIEDIQEKQISNSISNSISNTYSNSKIKIYIRKGSYKNFYYQYIRVNLSHIEPIFKQGEIVDSIIEVYNNKRATIFIQGVSGAGKSTIGYLVAKRLNASYCHTFNPTEPGDFLSNLMVDVSEEPIVIVIEEVDVLLKKIHQGIEKNNETPIMVHNKATWSNFLDDLFLYNILLIFTSNTTKEDIDKLDPSYLRKGRIHEYYCMNEQICLF
jgi:hypothetical protein